MVLCTISFQKGLKNESKIKRISVSVGVVWEESSSELETMLRRADDLMYAEKKKYYEKHGTM